jgi:hypothetical protein
MGGLEDDELHACAIKATETDAKSARQVLRFIARSLSGKKTQTGANVTAVILNVNME